MTALRALAAVLALGAAASTTPAAAAPAKPQAAIDTGRLAGVSEQGVQVFKGIPYAAPPVGPLRWKAPQPAAHWDGVRDASRFGSACAQPADRTEFWAQVGPSSEDCLVLNVWRPKAAGKYPVMVFLHGGGFTYGAAGVPLYDGAALARRGVVMVTLNYRLGRFGYFAHPALTREDPNGRLGNYGIMDQIEALRWVQRNITQFGGDPKNVTVFGESAGAGTVQILMGSTEAKGLFHKAASQSGAGGTPLPPIRGGAGSAEAQGEQWAKSLGLTDPTPEQLRAVPADKVQGRAFPSLDGKVVQHSPGAPFHNKTEAKVPLIIGSNSYEASLAGNTDALTKMVLGAKYGPFLEEYRQRPGTWRASPEVDLREDVTSVQQSMFIADMHAAAGAPAFAYYFDQVPASIRTGSLGTEHGGELEYLFGAPADDHKWDAQDWKVSRLMGDYWVRFAKTGNPNGGPGGDKAPAWPRVDGKPTTHMVFGEKTGATRSTDLEERVKAVVLGVAAQGWAKE